MSMILFTAPLLFIFAISALIILIRMIPLRLWATARFSDVPVQLRQLSGMRMRQVNPAKIINPVIKATKAGVEMDINALESHHMAGGNTDLVVDALIAAHRAKIDLDFEQAAAIDLAGRDVFEAVQISVNPKVISTPLIAGVAQDGVEVKAEAKITVRANIEKLIGGAGEETIIARVGEGIVTTIGSSSSHKQVLESPELISETVLNKRLEEGTAFTVLSVDIADVDIGENIGANLEAEQAEADMRVSQAKAEEQRSFARAKEAENLAEIQKNKALVVKEEAEVPKALAEAMRKGYIRVEEYYDVENLQADTRMRQALADSERTDGKN